MGKVYRTKSDDNIFKALRKSIGLSQAEVAEILHLNTSTVSKWETGATIPDQSILPRIAKLYNVSTDILLNYTPPMFLFDKHPVLIKPIYGKANESPIISSNLIIIEDETPLGYTLSSHDLEIIKNLAESLSKGNANE